MHDNKLGFTDAASNHSSDPGASLDTSGLRDGLPEPLRLGLTDLEEVIILALVL